jgi:hypothetical protein
MATSNSASNTDNIAIASSVSVSIVLTIGIIVVVFIIVRRKTNFSLCTKTRKSNLADHDTPGIYKNIKRLIYRFTRQCG